MRVFKNRWFTRFARKERLPDELLCNAVDRAQRGLIDDDLGGGIIKQRIARLGAGKSGGYRTVIAYRTSERAIFAYGFAKNDKANLSDEELVVYRQLAVRYLSAQGTGLEELIASDGLVEVTCDE